MAPDMEALKREWLAASFFLDSHGEPFFTRACCVPFAEWLAAREQEEA
jgi:hypothetical protein